MNTNSFTVRFSRKVQELNLLTDEEEEKMVYGMTVSIHEISKILLLSIVFGMFGVIDQFLFAFAVLTPLRTFSGGLHFYTWKGCFLFTLFFFSVNMILSTQLLFTGHPTLVIAIGLLCIACTLVFAPKTSKYRPVTKKKYSYQAKIISTCMTLLWFVAFFTIIHASHLINIGIWTIVLQNIQLLIAGGIKYEK